MPHVSRYGCVWLMLCLTLLAGCGGAPLPLPVAGMAGPTSASVNSPQSTFEPIDSGDSIADSPSEVPTGAAPVDVTAPDSRPTSTAFDGRQLVGCWRDGFCGQRTLTLKADGSATMLLELDFAGRLLYGKTLEFDLQWSLDGSTLSFEILTGRPVDAAKSAMKLWGEAFDYRIELVDNEHLHGWASDDSILYKLRRIEPAEASGGETR